MPAINDSELRTVIRERALESVYWSRKAPVVLPKDRSAFYEFIAERIGAHVPIDYLEFGVAHGDSMRLMARHFLHPDTRFFGFDSFVGLPERWQHHEIGAFDNKGEPPRIDDQRVHFVKGWFQNSVPEFFRFFPRYEDRPVLVHINSDLYSSALFLLTFLWPRFDDYFVLFDDFLYDEVVALGDFMASYPVDVQFIAQTKGGGERPNPDQVFARIRRKSFQLQS